MPSNNNDNKKNNDKIQYHSLFHSFNRLWSLYTISPHYSPKYARRLFCCLASFTDDDNGTLFCDCWIWCCCCLLLDFASSATLDDAMIMAMRTITMLYFYGCVWEIMWERKWMYDLIYFFFVLARKKMTWKIFFCLLPPHSVSIILNPQYQHNRALLW